MTFSFCLYMNRGTYMQQEYFIYIKMRKCGLGAWIVTLDSVYSSFNYFVILNIVANINNLVGCLLKLKNKMNTNN